MSVIRKSTRRHSAKPNRIAIPKWVDREHGFAFYCPKHNYGPMDVWSDCHECCQIEDPPKSRLQLKDSLRKNEISEQEFIEGKAKYEEFEKKWPVLLVSKILKKIPREKADEWLACFKPCELR